MSMSLPKQLQPLAKIAVKSLGLSHIRIRYELHTDLGDYNGLAHLDPTYYRATIQLEDTLKGREAQEVLLHELLHIAFMEWDTACTDVLSRVNEEEQEIAREQLNRGQEQVVERLSRSLLPILLKCIPQGVGATTPYT